MQARRQKGQRSVISKRLRESGSILLSAVALFMLIALVSFSNQDPGWSHVGQSDAIHNLTGRMGALLSDVLFSLLGYIAYLFPLAMAYLSVRVYKDAGSLKTQEKLWLIRGVGFMMTLIGGCGLTSLHYPAPNLPLSAGGALGAIVNDLLVPYIDVLGSTVVLLGLFLAGFTLFTGLSWLQVMDWIGHWVLRGAQHTQTGLATVAHDLKEKAQAQKARLMLPAPAKRAPQSEAIIAAKPKIVRPAPKVMVPEQQKPLPLKKKKASKVDSAVFKPTDADGSAAPSLSLLETAAPQQMHGFTEKELQDLSTLVETRLGEFNVEAKVVAVSPGPVITRFELDLAPGVKVSKIVGLSKDLARALSVVSLRVVDVIPGKSTVGLEIPNQERETVRLKEILQDAAYQDARSHLTMGLGKDISGQAVVADLSKMPHLLVAGTTGSGKSVGLNAMLLSILYKATPQDVRLIMIDPKMLELAVYDNIPHLLTPVVTDMKEAANALRWCVAEMERRYQLMAALGVRHLSGFNKKVLDAKKNGKPILDPLFNPTPENATPPELEKLPHIVVLIDEFADMMMVVGKKVEELIARLAQKARAAGIHMICATQRPSVDVITGLIKANIPTRIAFQVSSRIDSRTILDQPGAEQLLGHGDMLYLPPGSGIPIRIHGAFVADEEVHKVANELRARGKPAYVDAVVKANTTPLYGGGDDEDSPESDELYDEAVAIVLESRRASISYVQRRLKIGYNRAARLIEHMEQVGIVSPVQSNGSREVLVGQND